MKLKCFQCGVTLGEFPSKPDDLLWCKTCVKENLELGDKKKRIS